MEDEVMEIEKAGEVYITPIKPMEQSRLLADVRELVKAIDAMRGKTEIEDVNCIQDIFPELFELLIGVCRACLCAAVERTVVKPPVKCWTARN